MCDKQPSALSPNERLRAFVLWKHVKVSILVVEVAKLRYLSFPLAHSINIVTIIL